METYQAIYDAVRSRISGGDIGAAIESVIREANLSHHAERAAENIRYVAASYECPSVKFRPTLRIEGNQWCALYGETLQEGVAGFGNSPDAAMLDFDKAWYIKMTNTEGAQDE